MKFKWLHNTEQRNIIVFFNGWGMDEAVVSHLEAKNYDVIMFYDYNDLSIEFDFTMLNKYQKIYIVAWSMGVMLASLFDINFHKSIAINGTLKPIDNQYGIPEKIYDLTIKSFNENSAKKFIENMFIDLPDKFLCKRELDNQKSELVALKNYIGNENFVYDKVIISSADKIIPTKNQVAYWNLEPNFQSGHCPFFSFQNWEEIL